VASRDDVFRCVSECVADSLAVDAARIALTSRLIDDLGADSLDFLDILFRLESRFAVKLGNADIDRLTRGELPGNRPAQEQFVSPEDLARLDEWLPALRTAPERDRITPRRLLSCVTAEALVLLVERSLSRAPACDGTRRESPP